MLIYSHCYEKTRGGLMVNRKLERRLVIIGSIWQIVSGILTIFVYASFIKKEGLNA